jgi:hypothetical protein
MLSGAGEFVNLVQDELGISSFLNAGDNAPILPNNTGLGLLIGAVAQHTCRLYLPQALNYNNVDGAVVYLESRKQNEAHVSLIQITLAMKHKESDKLFYAC